MRQIVFIDSIDNVMYTFEVKDLSALDSIGNVIEYHVGSGNLVPIDRKSTPKSTPKSTTPEKHRTSRTIRNDSAENKARIEAEKNSKYAPLQGAGTEKQKIEAAETMAEKAEIIRKDQAEKSAKKTTKKSESKTNKAQNDPKINDVVVKLNLTDHGISITYADGGFINNWAVRKIANGMLKSAGLHWDNNNKTWTKSSAFDLALCKANPDGIIVSGEHIKSLYAEYETWKAAHPDYVSKKNRKSNK